MPDFLNIPGNIRQQYMPFTIKGSDDMQLFTFKEKMRKHTDKGGVAIIHPFSKHLGTLIQNDSSISYTHGPDGNKKVTYEQFLDEIPSLQIREFVPDAKLTQTFKWFSYLKKGFDNAMKSLDTEAAGGWQNVKEKLELALKDLSTAMKELTSGNAERLAKVVSGLTGFYQDRGFNVGDDDGLAVLWLPFILYYRLTTTRTNNIYEFPTSMQNNIFESDGTYGWGDDNGTDFPLLDVLGDKARSLVGLASSGLASTIRVNAMPAFSPTGSAAATSFDVHIDLINDSEEAAINNFLFCHTLFGNNRWLQYGFVQTGASLYDVKFPGANRFFMCKGKFVCKGKGAFRTPSQNVIEAIVGHAHPSNTVKEAWKKTKDINGKSVADNLGESEARMQIEKAAGLMNSTSKKAKRSIISESQMFLNSAANAVTKMSSVKTRQLNNGSIVYSTGFVVSENGSVSNIGKAAEYLNQNKEAIDTANNEIKSAEVARDQTIVKKREVTNALEKLENGSDKEKEAAGEILKSYGYINDDGTPNTYMAKGWIEDGGFDMDIGDYNSKITAAQERIANIRNFGEEDSEARQQFQELAQLNTEQALAEASETIKAKDSVWRDLIKIPDVYSLTLTFSSLIPDNFNNYLYGWRAANLDPIDNYFRGNVNELGAMEELVNQLITAVGGK